MRESRGRLARRDFLKASVVASGALVVGFDRKLWPGPAQSGDLSLFAGGKLLGLVDFVRESRVPLDTLSGAGLDGRLYADLSAATPEDPITPSEKFYVRTRASELLDDREPWFIRLGGLVSSPRNLTLAEMNSLAKPMGVHLMECAGNMRATRFALLSAAEWAGAPVLDVVDRAAGAPGSSRVLISGFDRYPVGSTTSIPGASWIFTRAELESSNASLVTQMNGKPLARDHGAPVRLIVPGWYGCACIKWVNEITLVKETAEATSQMQEFATRTHQNGVPKLAKDYSPATIDQAAMPIRIEKWIVDGKIKYRVVGLLWGGSRRVQALQIRFNPEEEYVPVSRFQHATNDPWSFWAHAWTPKQRGTYLIRLRIPDPTVRARRLDAGHYVRSVEIIEV